MLRAGGEELEVVVRALTGRGWPSNDLGVDVVLETRGGFTGREGAQKREDTGAEKVLHSPLRRRIPTSRVVLAG